MTGWTVDFHKKAEKEFARLNNSTKSQIAKAINKVSQNPLPKSEGGYGKPLGNNNSSNLAGCLKIKLKSIGHRVVYRLIREKTTMKIIIISIRDKDKVYKEAEHRMENETT